MRSTASRRAKNSDSVIVVRRRPASRPSRLRCFFASSLVDPLIRVGSLLNSFGSRGVRTLTTVFGGNCSPSATSPSRRRERRRTVVSPDAAGFLSSTGRPRFLSMTGVGRSGAMNNMDVAVTATGAAAACGSDFAADFLPAFFSAAGASSASSFATVFLAAGFLVAAGFFSAGFLSAGCFTAGIFSVGFASTTFLAAGFFAEGFAAAGLPVDSTDSEFSFFTISGVLQAVSVSGHTHRLET